MAQDYMKGLLSGGEVVLVDTRQHWMAAIRYALKPILLIGAVILLAMINSWLSFDGALSFINDVVSWVLIIMVIVSVVWLPINLVQWYSRKYVLTNRRAMRMSGVFRKRSFDSSLEQINDIAVEQSVFGRALGYADLTLYTASDTANESYEQLLDGMQFKKAVLDAKEGIRDGTPLEALPEGFIVRGGSNEASMRADGKIEEAAANDGPPAAQPESAAPVAAPPVAAPAPEPIAPEPIAEPALVVEPEPVVAAEPEPAAPPAPDPVVAAEPEPEPVAEPEPEPVAEPEPEPVAEPEPAAEAPSEAWPEADAAKADDASTSEGDDKPA